MTDYSQYLNLLNDFETENKEATPEPVKQDCCDKKEIKYDYTYAIKVCDNCGTIEDEFDTENHIAQDTLNPLYQLSSKLSNISGKYRALGRLNYWKDKAEIKEMNANSRYDEIKEMVMKLSKDKEVATTAMFLYKDIYIEDNVCSRGKIRMCNYVFCIYKSFTYHEQEIDIFKLLKEYKLTIKNFNDSLKNINGDCYLHKDLDTKRNILNKNYNLNITQSEFVKEYNKILSVARTRFKKINFNNIIVGTLINLSPNKDIIKFCKVFKIKDKVYEYGYSLTQETVEQQEE